MILNKKKFLGIALLILLAPFSFSVSYDFGVGMSLGYQTPQTPTVLKSSNFGWLGGGFLGGGVAINSKSLTHSFGLEYQAFYQENYSWYTLIAGSDMDQKITEKSNYFRQNVDFYYKLGVMAGKLPLDIQFNLGIAMLNPLDFYHNSTQEDLKGILGHGLHLGMRLNYSLAFLELNYSYIPGNAYYRGHEHLDLGDKLNANTFSVSIGVLFNKSNLDYFLKK